MKRFLLGCFVTLYSHLLSVILSIALTVVGIWVPVCLYIGLALLASNILVAVFGGVRMYRLTGNIGDLEGMFDGMKQVEENLQLHGEDLLTLSDEDLFETVSAQNEELTEDAEDAAEAFKMLTGARRTVYVLWEFDLEVQNGGLCQFFVNSSRAVAPFVNEALQTVGAEEHRALLMEFVTENGIDLSNLESFKVFSTRGYGRQTRRYDFDVFDDKYYELPALQDMVTAYIKAHISEF